MTIRGEGVVVTGKDFGIGKALVKRFKEEGLEAVIGDISRIAGGENGITNNIKFKPRQAFRRYIQRTHFIHQSTFTRTRRSHHSDKFGLLNR